VIDWSREVVSLRRAGSLSVEIENLIQKAETDQSLDSADMERLKTAASYLQEWQESSVDPARATPQLEHLQIAIGNELNVDLFNAILERFPKPKHGKLDLTTLVLGARARSTIDVLLNERLIRPVELSAIAKRSPAEFFRSPALDVLVSEGIPAPRATWKRLDESASRPTGFLATAEVFSRSFIVDKAPDASKFVVKTLADSPLMRRAILRALLKNPFACFRLAHYLSFDQSAVGSKRKNVQRLHEPVIADWLAMLDDLHGSNPDEKKSALLVSGLLQFAVGAGSPALSPNLEESIVTAAHDLAVAQSVWALRESEGAPGPRNEDTPWVLTRLALDESVKRYLAALPLPNGEDLPPERSLRVERHLGRRSVLVDLLRSLERTELTDELRDSVNAVLFNAGVREIGKPGDTVTYDVRIHETDVPGILPNEVVTLEKPPRILGSLDDYVLLAKGAIRPATAVENTQ
jgi:hypothetical protein